MATPRPTALATAGVTSHLGSATGQAGRATGDLAVDDVPSRSAEMRPAHPGGSTPTRHVFGPDIPSHMERS